MRKIIRFLIFYVFLNNTSTNAQVIEERKWLTYSENERQTKEQIMENKAALTLSNEDNLVLIASKEDKLGQQHHQYQQFYKGVKIEDGMFLLHEQNGLVHNANGNLIKGLELNTTPSFNKETALEFALQQFNATRYAWEDISQETLLKEYQGNENVSFFPTGELVIVQAENKYNLAYKFAIYSVEPLKNEEVYIDAHNGLIIKTIEKLHNCTSHITSNVNTNYSGSVSIVHCSNGDLQNTIGTEIKVFDAGGDDSFPETLANNNDVTASEVFWALEKGDEYLSNVHNRNSLNGSGSALWAWTNFGNNYVNAFWTGNWMGFGNGNSNFGPLTSPDIVGHEMAHGLTQHSSGLVYSGESGALNESFSDIFGELIENYSRGTNDWLIGSDFTYHPNFDAFRNMADPDNSRNLSIQPDTYLGNHWVPASASCSYTNDYCGVHTNSGVQNYWFYLLAEGGHGVNDNGAAYNIFGIGLDKAADIAYRNLTVYLNSNSNYLDARNGSIQSAIDLFGPNSIEVLQTEAAWCAVGVGNCSNLPNSCRLSDSLTLVTLYNAWNGPNWNNPWNLNLPMDTWNGVTLNQDGCVAELNLVSDSNISGTIPSEIGNLINLNYLYLHGLDLSGSIPSEIGNLTKLTYLSLSSCSLNGNIPPEIGNLDQLTQLTLSVNQLSGTIPIEITNLDALLSLRLQANQLSGNLPTHLFDMNSLQFLYLNNNNFSGSIPPEIENMITLETLRLNGNNLTGNIPEELGKLVNLKNLNIHSNQLIGTIPKVLGDLIILRELYLYNNELGGSIPNELGNLTELNVLSLNLNNLTGYIPSSISNLQNLYSLNISNNQMEGCYSNLLIDLCTQLNQNTNSYISNGNNFDVTWEDFCNNNSGICNPYSPCRQTDSLVLVTLYNEMDGANWSSLWNSTWDLSQPIDSWDGVTLSPSGCVECLDLDAKDDCRNTNFSSGFNLSGNIPAEIGNFSDLKVLILSDNSNITGNIPPELVDLSSLEELYIANTQITGSIPSNIANLGNLSILDLYGNQLSGNIPVQIGNIPNLERLYLYSNQLSGNIPFQLGGLTRLIHLELGDNQLTGNIPTQLGNLSSLRNLGLSLNLLSGDIPIELAGLTNLYGLILSDNDFSGTIPKELGNLTNLYGLYLDDNQFGGSIPKELGNLSNLGQLYLERNQLSGSIPKELENTNVYSLYLDGNQLSGSIPPELANLNLKHLRLDNNNLSGEIPASLGGLNFYNLELNNNQLSGCYNVNLMNLCDLLVSSQFVVSDGNNFDAAWEDFCNSGAGACTNYEVWPGDFNSDGIANNTDLLYWGLSNGSAGPSRTNTNITWIGQDCDEWTSNIGGINAKHQDGNGDGVVDANDISSLEINYSNTHNYVPPFYNFSPSFLMLEQPTYSTIGSNSTLEYELYLDSDIDVSAHGVAGSIDLSNIPNVVSVVIDISNSALQPDEQIEYFNAASQVFDFALTKTDGINEPTDGPLLKCIIQVEDMQSGENIFARISNGKMISANGFVTSLNGSSTQGAIGGNGLAADEAVFVSVSNVQCGSLANAVVVFNNQNNNYTYLWSNGETTQEVSDLEIGSHYVTINGLTTINFEVVWEFAPVDISASGNQVSVQFPNGSLNESVQISLDNGDNYQTAIMADKNYAVSAGTHQIWIQRVADECPVYLGSVTTGSTCRSSARFADAKLTAISSSLAKFTQKELNNNYITAEKAYINHQKEIHRILNSDTKKFAKVSADFDEIKKLALPLLLNSFINNKTITVNDNHLLLINRFLNNLYKVTDSEGLKKEIKKIQKYLYVMNTKEIKQAIVAFDQAKTRELVANKTGEFEDSLSIQLINSFEDKSQLIYQTNSNGKINFQLVDINGLSIRKESIGSVSNGSHTVDISKNNLAKGIYYMKVTFESNSGSVQSKVVKIPMLR